MSKVKSKGGIANLQNRVQATKRASAQKKMEQEKHRQAVLSELKNQQGKQLEGLEKVRRQEARAQQLGQVQEAKLPNEIQHLLFNCVKDGNLKGVRILLDKGASADKKDTQGFNAFHRAVDGGHLAIVKLMLEKTPALLNESTALGHTPLDLINYAIAMDVRKDPKVIENCKKVLAFLIEKGAQPGSPESASASRRLGERTGRGGRVSRRVVGSPAEDQSAVVAVSPPSPSSPPLDISAQQRPHSPATAVSSISTIATSSFLPPEDSAAAQARVQGLTDALNQLEKAWKKVESLAISLGKRGHGEVKALVVGAVVQDLDRESRKIIVEALQAKLKDIATSQTPKTDCDIVQAAIAGRLRMMVEGISTLQDDKSKWKIICTSRGFRGKLLAIINRIVAGLHALGVRMKINKPDSSPRFFSPQTNTEKTLRQVICKVKAIQRESEIVHRPK